jgi:hypothetical protein
MPVVTYEYDSWSSNPGSPVWVNPEKAVDGDNGQYATVYVQLNQASGRLYLDSNDCPGTNLGSITKVELGADGYRGDPFMFFYIEPDGGDAVGPYFLDETILWEDATSAHATGWTWSNIDSTVINFWVFLQFNGFQADTCGVDQIYIRVTYDEVFGPANIAKVCSVLAADIDKVHGKTYVDLAKINSVA